MKKTLIAFGVLLMQLPLFSQSVFWEEKFDAPPPNWVMQTNWSVENGALDFHWNPVQLNYDSYALSGDIALPQNVGDLIVSQYLQVFTSRITTEKASISVVTSSGEDELWFYTLSSGNWGNGGGTDLRISLGAYAGTTVKLKFRSWGPTTDAWYDWFIYNIAVDRKSVV